MKGLEFKMLLGLIVLIAVILLIAIIVFAPALGFGKSTQSRTKFEEFCVFWSLSNYKEGWNEPVKNLPNTPEYLINNKPSYYCFTIGISDVDTCRKCCKKEVAC